MAISRPRLNDPRRGQAGAKPAGGSPSIGTQSGAGREPEWGARDRGQPDRGGQTGPARFHGGTAGQSRGGEARSVAGRAGEAVEGLDGAADGLLADGQDDSELDELAQVVGDEGDAHLAFEEAVEVGGR